MKFKSTFFIVCIIIGSILICPLIMFIHISPIPSILTKEDVHVMESYLHFKFPESTKTIKVYWSPVFLEPPAFYLFFEFDNKDIDRFLASFHWENMLEKLNLEDLAWQNVQNANDIERSCRPVIKSDVMFFGDPGPSEELEWWKPDKHKIKKVFWLPYVKLKESDVYISHLDILLEELETTYKVYIYVKWENHEGGGNIWKTGISFFQIIRTGNTGKQKVYHFLCLMIIANKNNRPRIRQRNKPR